MNFIKQGKISRNGTRVKVTVNEWKLVVKPQIIVLIARSINDEEYTWIVGQHLR